MNCKWYYVLLGENSFYSKKTMGLLSGIFCAWKVDNYMVDGDLFSYFEDVET